MSQKEKIINILKKNEEMTQADLSIELYGDNNHLSNVYASLMSLIKDGVVSRSGNQPSYYSLISDDARSPKKGINKVENKERFIKLKTRLIFQLQQVMKLIIG